MTRLCSYGMEVLGVCHVASWQNAEVFLQVLGTEENGYINYVKGANVAGFMKVAKAMMAQGIV